MNLYEMEAEVRRLCSRLDVALAELRENATDLANSEAFYRKEKAIAWVEVKDALPKATVPEREAWVNSRTADLRLVRDMAENMRQVGLESVRSLRTQLSACQSVLAAHTAEAKLASFGPQVAA